MSNDDEDLGYARKEDDDRTLYLRRTGFGRAGRDILSSRAPPAHADDNLLRASSDKEERGGLIAPRYGAQGGPRYEQYSDDDHSNSMDMDELDEQNFGDSFDSPPRNSQSPSWDRHSGDRMRGASGNDRNSDHDDYSDKSVGQASGNAGGSKSENHEPTKKILPPPKMPPPRGARPSAAVSAVRNQLGRAPPPGKPAPSGHGGGAAAQYRARLLAKQRAAAAARASSKTADEGKMADTAPTPYSAPPRGEDGTGSSKFDGEGNGSATHNFRDELRRVVQNDTPPKARRGTGRASKPHPFGAVTGSSDEEEEDNWKNREKEKAVMSVFSHEWELQSPDKNQNDSISQHSAGGRNLKVHRPVGSLRGALTAQASYDMGDAVSNGGPSITVLGDDNDNAYDDDKNRYDDEDDDAGDRGDGYDDDRNYRDYDDRGPYSDEDSRSRRSYSDDERSYDDYSPRGERSKARGRDRNYDGYNRRDSSRSPRRERNDSDDYYDDRETPVRAKRGEGKSDGNEEAKPDKVSANVMTETEEPSPSGQQAETAETAAPAPTESKSSEPNSAKFEGMQKQDAPGASSESLPGKISVYDARNVPHDRKALIEWVLNPPVGGEEQMVQAFVERDKSGALGRFYPLFRFYVEVPGSAPRLIMYSRKLKGTRYPNFLISLDESDMGKPKNARGPGYIGKMQGSGNNQFTMYDHGSNPMSSDPVTREARRELCVIAYASKNGTGRRHTQDRRMEVAIPAIIARPDGQEHSVVWRPRHKEDGMREWFRRIRVKGSQNVISRERLLCLHNRMWSHGKTSQLDEFMNRAQETSSKNFQLVVSPPEDPYLRAKYDASPLGTIDTDDVANVLVQMGRCSDRFNIDFQYPVSAFAAFGICLTRFCGIGQT